MIADDVGITTGALYHYTESKAELYAAVYCETINEVYTEFETAAAEHTGCSTSSARSCVEPPRCKRPIPRSRVSSSPSLRRRSGILIYAKC